MGFEELVEKLMECMDIQKQSLDENLLEEVREVYRKLEEELRIETDSIRKRILEDRMRTLRVIMKKLFVRRGSKILNKAIRTVFGDEEDDGLKLSEKEKEIYDEIVRILKEYVSYMGVW